MGYSVVEANRRLDNINTEAELRTLIEQLDVSADGKTTVLYSGSVNGKSSGDLIKEMLSDNHDIRVLDNTKAATFLSFQSNPRFDDALRRIFGDDPRLDGRNGTVQSKANKFLFGESDANGQRISTGAWDIISRNFVAETEGSIRVIAPEGRLDRVFAQTEVIAILNNEKITHVDGFPRVKFVEVAVQKGSETLAQLFIHNSFEQAHISGLTTGKVSHFLELVDDTGTIHYEQFAKDYPEFKQNYINARNALDDLSKNSFDESRLLSQTIGNELVETGKLSSAANKLGPLGVATGFLLATAQASAAEEDGNHKLAKQIMIEWAADSAGSIAGEAAGAAVASIALGLAAAAGVAVSAPLAGVALLGASLVGGIFGADAATQMYNRFENLDQAGKEEFLEQVTFVLFGEYSVSDFRIPDGLLTGETITIDASFDKAAILQNVENSIAWRFALVHLNTFVIEGEDSIYENHNRNGELDLDNFSQEYLNDRAEMLAWRLQYDNAGKEYTEDWNTLSINGDWNFIDNTIEVSDGVNKQPLTFRIDGVNPFEAGDHQVVFGAKNADNIRGDVLSDRLYGLDGNDEIDGYAGDDYIEGGKGNDHIWGGEGGDTIFGGDGNDTIFTNDDQEADTIDGGKGDDYFLIGSGDTVTDIEGDDTYLVDFESSSDQRITINDTDGKGRLVINRHPIADVVFESDNVWKSGIYTLTVNSTSLLITDDQNNIVEILNYQEGSLGITLGLEIDVTPDPITIQNTFTGDNSGPKEDLIRTYNDDNDAVYSGELNDVVYTYGGDDYVESGSGDDKVDGFLGNDQLYGGEGNDQIIGGADSDAIYGESGNDIIILDYADDITGAGNEFADRGENWTIAGWDNQLADGGEGDDRISGGGGNDIIIGGEGNNDLNGGSGRDNITAGSGDDLITGDGYVLLKNSIYVTRLQSDHSGLSESYDDQIDAGDGNNVVSGGAGSDVIKTGSGNDRIHADQDIVTEYGGGYSQDYVDLPDHLNGNDTVNSGAGNDEIIAGGGNDFVNAGDGDDKVWGDDLTGVTSGGNDIIYAGAGSDVVYGGKQSDFIYGGSGDDALYGNEGSDFIYAGTENDVLHGNEGADFLYGEAGDDTILGHDGNDLLVGGSGVDYLGGGEGRDTYRFEQGDAVVIGGIADTIVDSAGEGNQVIFGAGINVEDINLTVAGNNLHISYFDEELIITDGLKGTVSQFTFDASNTTLTYQELFSLRHSGAFNTTGTDESDELFGGAGDSQLEGGLGNDILRAGSGMVRLFGDEGDDQLHGGIQDDELSGGTGDDFLSGGEGDDALFGGSGADSYHFIENWGQDVISDDSIKQLSFAQGINSDDMTVSRESDDLILELVGSNNRVTILNWFAVEQLSAFEVSFADGQVWQTEDIYQQLESISGSDGNDLIWSDTGNINQTLEGGLGDDTYVVRNSGGTVVIDDLHADDKNRVFLDYESDGEVFYTQREGNNLEFTWSKGSEPNLIINNYFDNPQAWQLESAITGLIDIESFEKADQESSDNQIANSYKARMQSLIFKTTQSDYDSWDNRYYADGTITHTKFDNSVDQIFLTLKNIPLGQSRRYYQNTVTGESFSVGENGNVLLPSIATPIYAWSASGAFNSRRTSELNFETHLGTDSNDTIEVSPYSETKFIYNQEAIIATNRSKIIESDSQSSSVTTEYSVSGVYYKDELSTSTYVNSPFKIDIDLYEKTFNVQTVNAGGGDDVITGSGPAVIEAGAGNDYIYSNSYVGAYLSGGKGDDLLIANQQAYSIDNSRYVLVGGTGNDLLYGSGGVDTYVSGFDGEGTDTIIDAYGAFGWEFYHYLAEGEYGYQAINYAFNAEGLYQNIPDLIDDLNNIILDQHWVNDEGILPVEDILRVNSDVSDLNFSLQAPDDEGRSSLLITAQNDFDSSISVTLRGHSDMIGYGVELFEFNDTTLNLGEVLELASPPPYGSISTQYGSNESDIYYPDGADEGAMNGLFGTSGNDSIDGRQGDDEIYGGDGNDHLYGGFDEVINISLQNGLAIVDDSTGGDDHIYGEGGNDLIEGGSGSDSLFGGNDDDVLYGGVIADSAIGKDNNYRAPWFGIERDGLDLDEYYGWDSSSDFLDGGAGNDQLYGGYGDDTLEGGAGDDLLHGGMGNDQIYAESGKDTVVFNIKEQVYEYVNDDDELASYSIYTGEGSDTVWVSNNEANPTRLEFRGINFENLRFKYIPGGVALEYAEESEVEIFIGDDDGASAELRDLSDSENEGLSLLSEADSVSSESRYPTFEIATDDGIRIVNHELLLEFLAIKGSDANDELIGRTGDDVIYGYAGDDSIYGGDGNDVILGGTGNDQLTGGDGVDTYQFAHGDGQDTVSDFSISSELTRIVITDQQMDDVSFSFDEREMIIHYGSNDSIRLSSIYDFEDAQFISFELITNDQSRLFTHSEIVALYNDSLIPERIDGSSDDDVIRGTDANEEIFGLEGNDVINAARGSNYLDGGDGDDTLRVHKESANNTFIGGLGNDTIIGSGYADTYIFNLGDGQDEIVERIHNGDLSEQRDDILQFGTGIDSSDVQFTRIGNDLLISVGNAGDQILVRNWNNNGRYWLESFTFEDGNILYAEDIHSQAVMLGSDDADVITDRFGLNDTIYAGAGNDEVNAGKGSNFIDGGAGDDTLNAHVQSTNNIFIGGQGNDTITGSGYADTYIFNLGDGQDEIIERSHNGDISDARDDTLQFGEGIESSNVQFTRIMNDLLISVGHAGDQILVRNWNNNGRYWLESFTFEDGTVLHAQDVHSQAVMLGSDQADVIRDRFSLDDTIYAGAGNDEVNAGKGSNYVDGGAGDDTLIAHKQSSNNTFIGGLGNDTITGSGYADTYMFNLGDGQDKIIERSHNGDISKDREDALQFGEGIESESLWFSRINDDLLVQTIGTDDQVTINEWFLNEKNHIEKINTSNESLDHSQVDALVQAMAVFDAPSGAGEVIPQNVRDQLQPVLASSWQSKA